MPKKQNHSKWSFLNGGSKPVEKPSLKKSNVLRKGNKNAKANMEFYQKCWNHYPHICQNCGKVLQNFSPSFCAHLLTKAAFPRIRYNVDNVVILCLPCHDTLDCRKKTEMKIWGELEQRIEKLRSDYYHVQN